MNIDTSCECPLCQALRAEKLYYELLYAVARKFPEESRHETALRYIQEAETNAVGGPSENKNTQ